MKKKKYLVILLKCDMDEDCIYYVYNFKISEILYMNKLFINSSLKINYQ